MNRTLTFIKKYFGNVIPNPNEYDEADRKSLAEIENIGNTIGGFILGNEIDKALKNILSFSSRFNQYFQKKEPWKTLNNQLPHFLFQLTPYGLSPYYLLRSYHFRSKKFGNKCRWKVAFMNRVGRQLDQYF